MNLDTFSTVVPELAKNEEMSPSNLDKFRGLVRVIVAAKRDAISTLGELLAYGLKHYGEDTVATVLKEEKCPHGLAKDALTVARQVTRVRHFNVPVGYRLAVAKAGLPPAQQAKWLKTAFEEKLSIADFKKSLEEREVVRSKDSEHRTFQHRLVQGVVSSFQQWLSQTEGVHAIESWPRETLEMLRNELSPIDEFMKRLNNLLEN